MCLANGSLTGLTNQLYLIVNVLGLTLSDPFSSLSWCPCDDSLSLSWCPWPDSLACMDPTLSSFNRASNCFKSIDLFVPYFSNKLSTKDCAPGPFTLRAWTCEKIWQSVVLIRVIKQRREKTCQELHESIVKRFYDKEKPFWRHFCDAVEHE